MMTPEEVQDTIVETINQEFPTLRLETVCDIADIVGDGWDWKEEHLPQMKKYVQNRIGIYTKEEFITIDDELYEKNKKLFQDHEDMIMDGYCQDLMDKYHCVTWVDEKYKTASEELEKAYIWCD